MKEYDVVKLIKDCKSYNENGVYKGMVGTILDPRNINGKWLVYFSNPKVKYDSICEAVKEEDLELVIESE